MAAVKRHRREKSSGSPNIVLVLFLVLFVLVNLVLGLWLYFAYQERNSALTEKSRAEKEKDAANKAMKLYQVVLDDLRMASGQTLTETEKKDLANQREGLLNDAPEYKGVEDAKRPGYVELVKGLQKELGWDAEANTFKSTFQKNIQAETDR